MSKNLLIESMPSTLSIVESAGNKCIARGEFGRVGVPTQNGRIYPQKLMEREIGRLSEDLNSRRVLGELDHPSDGRTSLKRVSHVITGLSIKDGIVIGEAEILNTPEGKTLKALIEANVQVGVSSRGYGSTAPSRGKSEGEEVQEDFVLKTYDFVADPAMKTAIPGIYTEDVDDESIADMFVAEFPEIAEALKSDGDVGDLLAEARDKKSTKAEIEEKLKEELSEGFERRLRDGLAEMREEVVSEVKEELEGDPEVGGAKGVLEAIAEMVAVYRGDVDESAVKDAIKAAELEVSEANREREEAEKAGRRAAHLLYIERQIGKHPMAETIRKYFDKQTFKDLDEAKEALKTCLSDLPSSEDIVTKEESKVREENAELRGKITLLEGKVDELGVKLQKAVTLGERIEEQRIGENEEAREEISELQAKLEEAIDQSKAGQAEAKKLQEEIDSLKETHEVELYKRDKVVGFTNGRELIGLMESVHDRAGVDEFVEERGLREMADPELARMRRNFQKGKTSDAAMRMEEDVKEKPRDKRDVLGNDMSEMVALAGIPHR